MLLQRNIVKKYLSLLNEEQITKSWAQYRDYFLNADIQANIQKIKEEQFQEGFLRELFVKVLGYTINPSPNYNLTTELKNEVGSKKADGAIQIADKVIGVIELKDHKTPDLASIESQAFGYKSKHKDTRLVIISNFEKLRLYIDNAVEYREWDIFHMTYDDFRELYLCLAWTQVERGVALQMKEESVSTEDQITNALYKDYSQFKRVLFADIVGQNPYQEGNPWAADDKQWQLLLFKKTQKLLDRLLFIFFAEDCGLLPPNSMVQIIDQWEKLKELDEYRPFYDRVKKYFGYMNTGYQGKKYEIFAYNGGLFKPDEILDNIKISDELLLEHTRKLSEYDFESDVDVNILGHIFENSLSEIEEVTQQINSGQAPQTSKRKQDGVFYTPQYITKYIVENTVGRLCAEKKKNFGIVEDEYFSDQRRQLQTKKRLLEQLQQYRKWLLEITILDPACGSGAFLNAALQFLMAEHKHLDEMEAKVAGSAIVFQDVENSILEHNLYGVDINEESVEIAQLALWLRTAKPRRKLNSLNENIKCGNSLISDPVIAGDKAFDWQKEFPQVFEKGGFDVVIGNPPYGAKFSHQDIEYYLKTYKYQSYQLDSYLIFTEKTDSLVKTNGYVGFIMPNTWLSTVFSTKFRRFVFQTFAVKELQHYSYFVFPDATVETDVYILKKTPNAVDNEINVTFIKSENDTTPLAKTIHQNIIIEKNGEPINIYEREEFGGIKTKCENLKKLGELFQIVQGTKPFQKGKGNPPQTEDILKSQVFVQDFRKDETYLPCLRGSLINRYSLFWNDNYFISYGDWLAEPRYSAKFDTKEKLVIRQTGDSIIATYDDKQFICRDNLYVLRDDSNRYSLKALLTLLNSKFITWYYRSFINPEVGKTLAQVKRTHLLQLPIPMIDENMSIYAETMLSLNSQLQTKRNLFLRSVTNNLEGVKITTALQQFDQMDFKGLMTELKKQKIAIPLKQQGEWEEYFSQCVAECQALSAQIKATDEEIDNKVFDLYGLTEDERKTVLNV